jgi:aspartate/methionine/tyrosine aminotransferase
MQNSVRSVTRMDGVQAPIIPAVGDIIRQVPGTISLGQGIVHYGPPPEAAEAVRQALTDPTTHEYSGGTGRPDLVKRIAAKLAAENDINGVDASGGSAIMVTAGANMAFMHAVLAISEPGDEIILPVPFYFNHEMAIQMAGCRAVAVRTDANYRPDLDAIGRAITDRTRAIVTISPNNPTGAVFPAALLREVNNLCRDRGLYHISDETYEYFTYGSARHLSPGSLPGAAAHTVSIYSLSKAYGMAGWRIGYAVYPDDLTPAMLKIQDTILICPTVVAERAALAALEVGRPYCDPHVRELATIRQIVLDALGTLGPVCDVPPAEGAMYCFPRIATDLDAMTLTERLIREHRVAVTPGSAFGMTDGCYFRVAFGALQRETVAEGIGRLVAGLRAICG